MVDGECNNRMEKVNLDVVSPITEVSFDRTQAMFVRYLHRFRLLLQHLFINKGFILIIIGFLLGRALILAKISPFALPFFAAVYMMRKDRSSLAGLALVAGSLTLSYEFTVSIVASILLFLILQKISLIFSKKSIKKIPFNVFFASLIASFAIAYVTEGAIMPYSALMGLVESGLSFILTLIFIQSIPLLAFKKRKQAFKSEEVICFIILIASVLTGLIGWEVYNLSAENVMSRYLVLLLALVAGATVGSTVGVVTGLVLSLANVASLYQMSLLAFSGLLGGLLKDGRKMGVSIGLLLGTLLIGLYGEGTTGIWVTLNESFIAIALFFLTPQSLTAQIANKIPGTPEHSAEQMQYMRKVRDITANRVTQFSNVFEALSNSFSNNGLFSNEEQQEKEVDYFLSNVTAKTCQVCSMKEICWGKKFEQTYDLMTGIMYEIDAGTLQSNHRLLKDWKNHCSKADKVIEAMKEELSYFEANKKLKRQVQESRKLVADQLQGVSQVMGDFAREIKRERENHYLQEEQILDALQSFGIEIGHVEIYCLDQGNVDIEMSIPYCNGHGEGEKLIAPMLSDILKETIVVKNEECEAYPNGFCHISFGSAKAYVIETGVAHAAKGGGFISGDSYSMIELGAGKYAVAISDGMGNGERAHHESNETLKLLQKILQSGIEEKVAIKSVNSVLALRTTDEIFSTLDLAVIDLQNASVKFLKIGSIPSFIKRGDKVIKVSASNLPMGIIREFEVDVVSEQLKSGDLLIMMSDGIFEGPKHIENHDLWMKRKIHEMETNDPQEVADIIMEEVIRSRGGHIEDDMTVVVAQINRNTPKWASIPVHQYAKRA